jgi:RNA polymerase sigma-70 factor, ECF subfamily
MDRDVELNLIARALAGDRTATGELIRGHQGALYSYMLRMTRRVDVAEDLTQEALYKAIKNLSRYDTRWRFSTWLFTIARRLWMNVMERRTPAYDTELMDAMPCVQPVWSLAGWTAERSDAAERTRVVIERAMETLPDAQREAVVLCHQLGWSLKLASELMGLPEGTIKSHLFRARVTLREHLSAWYAREGENSQDDERAATSGSRWRAGGTGGTGGTFGGITRHGARDGMRENRRREDGP